MWGVIVYMYTHYIYMYISQQICWFHLYISVYIPTSLLNLKCIYTLRKCRVCKCSILPIYHLYVEFANVGSHSISMYTHYIYMYISQHICWLALYICMYISQQVCWIWSVYIQSESVEFANAVYPWSITWDLFLPLDKHVQNKQAENRKRGRYLPWFHLWGVYWFASEWG